MKTDNIEQFTQEESITLFREGLLHNVPFGKDTKSIDLGLPKEVIAIFDEVNSAVEKSGITQLIDSLENDDKAYINETYGNVSTLEAQYEEAIKNLKVEFSQKLKVFLGWLQQHSNMVLKSSTEAVGNLEKLVSSSIDADTLRTKVKTVVECREYVQNRISYALDPKLLN